VKLKVSNVALPLCLLFAGVCVGSAATVTYSFAAQVPTNNGPMPGNFLLTVPTFVTGIPLTEFTGTDFTSCSAPGTGPCIAEFSVGPSPISGLANDIGFGNDVCCFIYFFPDLSFTTPGTYTADPFHSAGTATLVVSTNGADAPEPGTFGAAAVLALAVLILRKRSIRRGLPS
jgi:hypothetical protein